MPVFLIIGFTPSPFIMWFPLAQSPLTQIITYRKVASSRLPRLVAHFWIFRLLMKGKFDAYVP